MSFTMLATVAIAVVLQGPPPAQPPGIVSYNAAREHAKAGRFDEAFRQLDDAIARGVATPWLIAQDAELAALKADPRYAPMMERADRRASPCKYDERYRGLDFWLGDWDVVAVATGQRIGGNQITVASGGCAIHERWTSRNGVGGESLNYFDPASGVWRQIWVGQPGAIIRYEGTVKDGAMHYAGDSTGPSGARSLQRVVLAPQPDGRVRHTVETSVDDGKTWSLGFDAWYVKRR